MDVRRITTSEIIAAVGGALLALSVFLPWYSTNPKNPNANVAKMKGDIAAWDAHTILRYLLLAAAVAPIVLLYIVIRDHELSWPRSEPVFSPSSSGRPLSSCPYGPRMSWMSSWCRLSSSL